MPAVKARVDFPVAASYTGAMGRRSGLLSLCALVLSAAPAFGSDPFVVRRVEGASGRFEWRRVEYSVEGEYPATLVSWTDAMAVCEAQGKNLCTEDEWTFVCEGIDALPDPRGYERCRSPLFSCCARPEVEPEKRLACPSEMATVAGSCMDRFEAPNVAGERPIVAATAPEGEAWCEEHGKRLCTETEWNRACEGSARRPFPYGDAYRSAACNQTKVWRAPNWALVARFPAPEGRAEVERLDQSEPSGSFPACVSEDGAFDLTGNVAEWVKRTLPNPNNHEHVLKGCYWAGCYGGAKPGCSFRNPAHPGTFRTYEAGFRCCLTP